MTQPTEPTVPVNPPVGPPFGTPTRPRKPKRRWPWIAAAAVLVILLCGIGTASLFSAAEKTAGDGASEKPVATSAPTPTPTEKDKLAESQKTPTYPTPKPSDIKLTVKVLQKQCFGSAGCNVTYRISDVTVVRELDPEKTYEVSYEIKGAESPIIGTIAVTAGKYEVPMEEITQTKRSSDKLTAVVTAVEAL